MSPEDLDSDTFVDDALESQHCNALAYSLFDDFKATNTSLVYDHMIEKYGFDPTILGKGVLHRIALINYLSKAKQDGKNVLQCYKSLMQDPNIVLDDLEHNIKGPLINEKLIWDYMEESEDEDHDDAIIKQYILKEQIGCKNNANISNDIN